MCGPQQLLEAPHLRVAEALALVRQGRIRAASATIGELATTPDVRLLDPTGHALVLAITIECLLAQGDVAAATVTARQLETFGDGSGRPAAISHYMRGELAAALGDPDRAVEHHLASGRAEDTTFLPWRCGAALAMLRLGRRREALDLARDHVALTAHGTVYEVAWALRTLATTDPDGGAPRLREARELLVGSDAERLRAQIDTDLAGLLVLTGGTEEAVALLRSAERYAGREDLWPLQSRIRWLLERLGEKPRRMEAEALAVLTAAERRVALLALDGLTNRQIAEQLLVSIKAVEGHLSKVYRKLGVASRSALAASLRLVV